jgi:succinate dehydrogenase / fumarate reductase iron-sulfur subunit
MQVTLAISRFNPAVDKASHIQTFTLEAASNDRVLDLLLQVKSYQDSTLAFRYSCGHGVCGSDAMRINGRNLLACKVLVKNLGTDEIKIEPLLGLPVIKDLVVDMEPFFEQYRQILPYLIRLEDPPAPERENLQTPTARARYDDTTKCILCAACTTSCPVFWSQDKYIGPAAIVNAHRFIFDDRDQGTAQRLEIMDDQMGVWRCRTAFNCTEACPRDIKVTQAIAEVKRAISMGDVN